MDAATMNKAQMELLAKVEKMEAESAKFRKENGLPSLIAYPEIPAGEPGTIEIDGSKDIFCIIFKISKLDYNLAKDFVMTSFYHMGVIYKKLYEQMAIRQKLAESNGQRFARS